MPRPKDHEHEHEHDRKHDSRQRERKNIGDDPKRHTEIVAQRWLGSPPPTFDRFAKALKQWFALPGAVVRPAADVTGDEDKR
ncbi:MAG: hypothetical protein WCB99_07075 [Candidatus Cybelea sp.]|jgi:hypothetical protein